MARRRGTEPGLQRGSVDRAEERHVLNAANLDMPGGGLFVGTDCRVTLSPSLGNGAQAQNDSEGEHERLGYHPPNV